MCPSVLTSASRPAITQIWPAGETPRTTLAVAVVVGGVVVLTTTLEIGSTPMPPLNFTSEFSRIPLPKVERGTRARRKSPRPDLCFMTHLHSETLRFQLHRNLRFGPLGPQCTLLSPLETTKESVHTS